MLRCFVLLCAGAVSVLAQTPTTPPAISAYYKDVQSTFPYKWMDIDTPLYLTVDSALTPHLGLNTGFGIIGGTSLSLDTAAVAFRTTPPTGPGPCNDPLSPTFAVGTGAWAVDAIPDAQGNPGHVYFCIPNATSTGFIWARVPLSTVW